MRGLRYCCTRSVILITIIFVPASPSQAGETISFTKSTLSGTSSGNPTSLQFGPDGRLYVAQQNGTIKVYTVVRSGPNDYEVDATETINLIKSIDNHDDDGDYNPDVNGRLVTGLLVVGSASNPVIYVGSSDPRIGGGADSENTNLDTNSGIISRLTWTGSEWDRLDLVRGLPRSEENHCTNGMQLDASTNMLYVAQGGHTNQGAPSNNFVELPEYALSAAILQIDLDDIGNSTYDLPTLNDEDRPGNPDDNDPFGGNNGKNQARLLTNGPVRVFAPGFRNAYDILLTASGRMYTVDNGPNGGWGGEPNGAGGSNCTNQVSEPGDSDPDNLHYIDGPGYYGGHPNPTRANDNNAFNNSNPQSPVDQDNPVECTYREPGSEDGALVTYSVSTNGICEYTAGNFGGAMTGDLLMAGYDGKIFRVKLNGSGTSSVLDETLFSNVGSRPLDVIALGDDDVYPGTIWVSNHGSNNVVIYEPVDFFDTCTGNDNDLDEDGDGYSNADEIDNGTNPCSPGDVPPDVDQDGLSDLNDSDDDNDGIPDVEDPFAIDPENGMGLIPPVLYSWENDAPPAGGILNLGFTGLMINGSDNYIDLFDPSSKTAGGAAGVFTVDAVSPGDAMGNMNSQMHGHQFGVALSGAEAWTAHTRMVAPFFGSPPSSNQSMGCFVGTGHQDNYAKLVVTAGGLEFAIEQDGVYATVESVSLGIPGPATIDLFITIDTLSSTVQAAYAVNDGGKQDIGVPHSIPSWWHKGSTGVAIGLISTSRGGDPFAATWDLIEVASAPPLGTCVPGDCPVGQFCSSMSGLCEPTVAEADITITSSNNINASTYSSGSCDIDNASNGGVEIERVTFNLSSSLFPDIVFDPAGGAGDVVAKCLKIDSGASETGYIEPDDECSDPFFGPHDGGYDGMVLEFDDFDAGEKVEFSVDIDPTSIQGGSTSGAAGSVSGLEMTGAVVTVEFSNGEVVTSTLYRKPNSNGGGEQEFKSNGPVPPTIDVLSVSSSPAVVSSANQTVRVCATSGADVRLLRVEGALELVEADGFDIDPFEANTAVAIQEYSATTGGGGCVDIAVTLTREGPDAGLNHFVAVTEDPNDSNRVSAVSNKWILELDSDGECDSDNDCDDGNPCTADDCSGGACANAAVSDGTACNDGDSGTINDQCVDGVCVGETPKGGCSNDGDCADDDACTTDSCAGGSCVHGVATDGTPCDDQNPGTFDDHCIAGACVGTPGGDECDIVNDCYDGDPCTDHECNNGFCLHINHPDGEQCNDGDSNTINDRCLNGVCAGVVPGECTIDDDCTAADDEPCMTATCTDSTCVVANVADGTPCDDGDGGTVNDRCTAGACVGDTPPECTSDVDCADGNPCMSNQCTGGMCVDTPVPDGTVCDDGNGQTTEDHCVAGECAGTLDGDPCTIVNDCFDGDPCTDHSCDNGVCNNYAAPNGKTCNDFNDDTTDDQCIDGVCMGTGPQGKDADNDGLNDTIDPCLGDPRNACYGAVAIDQTAGLPVRINASLGEACSGQRVDCSGQVWFADYGFNHGASSICDLPNGCPIAGLDALFGSGCDGDDATSDLFRCHRWDNVSGTDLAYDFNVPDGEYLVNLMFASIWSGSKEPGDRVFDIVIEGDVVYAGFDEVLAAGVEARAVVRSAVVTVDDGNGLQISFDPQEQNPTIKAIEVLTSTQCEPKGAFDVTCDAIDDDCDGMFDEDATCDDGNECTADACIGGVCSNYEMLYDLNGDGATSVVGDVNELVGCLFNTNPNNHSAIDVCCSAGTCRCRLDCNSDGFVSIVGDLPCWANCLFFDNCGR